MSAFFDSEPSDATAGWPSRIRRTAPTGGISILDYPTIQHQQSPMVNEETGRDARHPSLSFRGHVLLVDDDESVRRLTALALRQAGVEVESAATGSEALEAVGARRPDLLLIDRCLPDIDGLKVIGELRRRETAAGAPWLPVVVVTGDPRMSNEGVCRDAGADGLLAKPTALDALTETLARFLERR